MPGNRAEAAGRLNHYLGQTAATAH
jgi:hypothetical protein